MLNQDQISNYHKDGYLSGIPILNEVEAGRYREQFDALEKREGQEKCQIGLQSRHFEERFIWELASNSKILDCIEALIGSHIMLLATHFFCKYGDGGTATKFVAWHQDVTYWGLEPPTTMTAWYAIDDSDVENGCMRCIPGSHIAGVREHGKSRIGGNLLSINQEVELSDEEEKKAVDFILKAGEISLHDGSMIHGSLPNRSKRRRCGLTLRFIPAHVRQVSENSVGKDWRPILMRGEAKNISNVERAPFNGNGSR